MTTVAWVAVGLGWIFLFFTVVAKKLPAISKKASRLWAGLGLFMLATGAMTTWNTFGRGDVWQGLATLAGSAALVPFAFCLAFLAPRTPEDQTP